MKRFLLPVVLALASVATAQRGPLPGIPITPPPVDHPALVAQPLLQSDSSAPGATKTKGGSKPAPAAKRQPKPIDPATVGVKKKGKALKSAVRKVVELGWSESLDDAKVRSAATGKPVLWLQTLGDIDGFA